jgi:hypothetical protein
MNTSKRVIQTVTIALALVCSMAKVSATVTYQIGNGGLETLNVAIDGFSKNGILCGGISIKQEGVVNSTMPTSYVTICTDIEGSLFLGQNYVYNSPASAFSGQSGVNPGWGTFTDSQVNGSAAKAIQNAAYLFYHYGQLTAGGIGGGLDNMTALQLAVWDVLYNTDVGGKVTGTRFSYSGEDITVQNDLNNWISTLNSEVNVGKFGYTGFLLYPDPATSAGTVNPSFGNSEPPQELMIAVPETTTIIAGALLLLPLGASTLRILNRKRTA